MSKTTILKKTALILSLIIAVVAIYYIVGYSYLYVKAAFTWQCKIYVGEMTPEGRKTCDDFNSGGLTKVLTN